MDHNPALFTVTRQDKHRPQNACILLLFNYSERSPVQLRFLMSWCYCSWGMCLGRKCLASSVSVTLFIVCTAHGCVRWRGRVCPSPWEQPEDNTTRPTTPSAKWRKESSRCSKGGDEGLVAAELRVRSWLLFLLGTKAAVKQRIWVNRVNSKLRGSGGGDPLVEGRCLSIWWKISVSFGGEEEMAEGESHLKHQNIFLDV